MSNENNEHWIPVNPSSGMFSSEYAISLRLANGQTVSFFVDKGQIREAAGQYLLKVTLVNNYPQQNKKLVLLPTETFETASRWVEVAVE